MLLFFLEAGTNRQNSYKEINKRIILDLTNISKSFIHKHRYFYSVPFYKLWICESFIYIKMLSMWPLNIIDFPSTKHLPKNTQILANTHDCEHLSSCLICPQDRMLEFFLLHVPELIILPWWARFMCPVRPAAYCGQRSAAGVGFFF